MFPFILIIYWRKNCQYIGSLEHMDSTQLNDGLFILILVKSDKYTWSKSFSTRKILIVRKLIVQSELYSQRQEVLEIKVKYFYYFSKPKKDRSAGCVWLSFNKGVFIFINFNFLLIYFTTIYKVKFNYRFSALFLNNQIFSFNKFYCLEI